MDTSKEYIKMCEEAKEIQGEWKPKAGDCYDSRGNTEVKGPKVLKHSKSFKVKRSAYQHIWLPRQDQLQEMYLDNRKNKVNCGQMSMFFEDWRSGELTRNKDLTTWSMEQLWIGFIMKEKFKKVYNGKDWTKRRVK